VHVVATAHSGQEQELSTMPGRFVNAIFGQLDCVLDISAGTDQPGGADRYRRAGHGDDDAAVEGWRTRP
jgi:hypothetical protein